MINEPVVKIDYNKRVLKYIKGKTVKWCEIFKIYQKEWCS